MLDPIVIVSAARTPIGGMLGDFSSQQAWELGDRKSTRLNSSHG